MPFSPANPGFYTLHQSVDDLVNMVSGRILDLLDQPHNVHPQWTGKAPSQDDRR